MINLEDFIRTTTEKKNPTSLQTMENVETGLLLVLDFNR
jgi:hypothetical protein